MKISIWTIGKRHEPYIREGINEFTRRIQKYFPVVWTIIPVPKNAGMLSEMDLRKKEAEIVLGWLEKDDRLIAMDERGTEFTSVQFATFFKKQNDSGVRNLVFLIGGSFGLDESILTKADSRISLSKLTFPHQLARLVLVEQIYRACTILRNEKYHHS